MKKGRLFLLPVPLGATSLDAVLPRDVQNCARKLTCFVAENAKSARAFLKNLPHELPLQEIRIEELNEHTPKNHLPGLLAPLLSGNDLGLISEAGCPAIADPGADLVALAHESGIQVVPMVGPSSILLALMASGFSGQNFAFHGYLPVKEDARRKKIVALEKDSQREHRTQIIIETPYRNRQMFETLIDACGPQTRIGVATDLSLPDEKISVHACAEWKKSPPPQMDKRPTVFLLQA